MKKQTGFTLVELMITLALAAIILTFAVPGFQNTIRNTRAPTQANTFVSALNLARSEAIKYGAIAHVEAVAPVGGNEYGGGWRVWVDLDNDNVRDVGANPPEEVSEFPALAGNSVLASMDGTADVLFSGNGYLRTAFNDPSTPLTKTYQLRISGCQNDQGRNITISPIGRPAVRSVVCP